MFQNKNSAAVKKNKLFKGVSEEELKLKFNPQNFLELKEGEIIYQKGEESNLIYLILEGEVKIKFIWTQEQRGVIRKYRDEFFGDDELLAKCSRRSSAVAMTDCLLYTISRKELEYLSSLNKPLLTNLGLPETSTDLYNLSEEARLELKTTTEKIGLPESSGERTKIENIDISPVEIPEISSSLKLDDQHAEYVELNIHPGINKEEFFKQELLEEPDDETSIRFSDTVEHEKEEFNTESNSANEELLKDEQVEELPETIPEPSYYSSRPDQEFNAAGKDEEITIDDDQYINIHSGINIEETFRSIIQTAKQITDADKGVVFISDEVIKNSGADLKENNPLSELAIFEAGTIAEECLNKKEIIFKNDISNDTMFVHGAEISPEYKVINMMCYPLISSEEKVLAVLQLLNSSKGVFDSHDEHKLNLLSKHFIAAIDRSTRFNDVIREGKLLSLKEISNFLISDIKIPVLTIKHYSNLLKKQNVTPEVKNILDMLTSQANSVIDLVQTTFDFAQNKKSLSTEVKSLSGIVDEILTLLSEYVESRNVKLFKKIESTAKIEIDQRAFYQACFQIAKNACDAMPNGGNIYVTCTSDDDFARIDIRDEGPGIQINIKDSIFEPFVSGNGNSGTGIGLSITKKIITDMNGTINVQSTPGEGTTFIILVPIVKN
ncbi:MAG: cyclic nucleotide-binding domain-containing protein [Ignavibacteriales bacterium]|nr:MAG: cyclic nucleotide-binding domain-containing protein [Ignavibacteriales bacterium]